jgi:hypothetical protein
MFNVLVLVAGRAVLGLAAAVVVRLPAVPLDVAVVVVVGRAKNTYIYEINKRYALIYQ